MSQTLAAPRTTPDQSRPSSWRPDIQGMRALAVLLVIASHMGIPFLGGGYVGVDVFFVLSGFLITQLLLREAEKTGSISIAGFYARRARRILPAASLVTIAVVLYALFFRSIPMLAQTTGDAGWASVFLANWHMVGSGADYFSTDDPSLLQHYWSLAVEEQFYLVWPLLALALLPRLPRRWFFSAAVVIFGGSLAWSAYTTGANPDAAYFDTFARAFELAAGAGLACVLTRPLAGRWAQAAGVGGIALIAIAALAYTESTAFPGWNALLPVAGTMLLLSAGPDTAVGRALSIRPLRYIGDISFSLYLWHWPVIQAVDYALPTESLLRWHVALGFAISFVLAVLTFHFVERPFQHRKVPWIRHGHRSLWLWPVSVGLVLAIGFGASVAGDDRAAAQEAAAAEWQAQNAQDVIPGDDVSEVQTQLEDALAQASDGAPIPPGMTDNGTHAHTWHEVTDGDCYASGSAAKADEVCSFGDTESDDVVALVGDSHAAMWLPAFDEIGKAQGIRIVLFAKLSCGAYPVVQDANGLNQGACDDFREWTEDQLEQLKPDTIVIGSRGQLNMSEQDGVSIDDQWSEGVTDTVTRFREITPDVVVFGDVPSRPDVQPVNCVDVAGASQEGCVATGDSTERDSNTITQPAAEAAGASFVDTEDLVCTDDGCPLFVGELPVYEDDSHLNRLWVEHVARALESEIEAARE